MNKDKLEQILSPSPLIRSAAAQLASASGPILDVAGGAGRHAFYLASLGANVVCLDIDLNAYFALRERLSFCPEVVSRVSHYRMDLLRERWPFRPGTFGAIIMVDFLWEPLFLHFSETLTDHRLLAVQTVGGHGQNYLQLPKAGHLKAILQSGFNLLRYEERKVGPRDADAVAVRLLAERR